MTQVESFTFNPFQENTYVLFDETNECVIIDPGCSDERERNILKGFIDEKGLIPKYLVNTHCHVDHVLGNKFIFDTYGLKPVIHQEDLPVLENATDSAKMFGFFMEESPKPEAFLEEGDVLTFGNTTLDVIFTPGHCPGEISLYNMENKFVIAGDVLFHQSIGRTDLPGGDYDTLIASIKNKLFALPEGTMVYCGHGPSTTIDFEKRHNPFLQ